MNLFNFPNLADIWNALGLYIEGSGGTSEFYANSTAAYRWILDQIINPNPRLTPEERAALADQLNAIYGEAFDQFGETPEGAFYVWETFSNYIYTLDNELGRAAETATEAQKDFNADKDKAFGDDLKNTPWWVWAGLAISVLTLVRK